MNLSDLPACHFCGTAPAFQWTRCVKPDESAAQKLEIGRLQGRNLADSEIAERYGLLRVAVTGCAVHHLGDDPRDASTGADRRALVHDADCGGHGKCTCKGVSQPHGAGTPRP